MAASSSTSSSGPPSSGLRGFVLAVPSGDTLIVSAAVPNGVPPRKKIKLSNVSAPQLGYYERADEPFAWEAREHLREHAIGKPVVFKIDNSGNGGREYGEVWIDNERASQWVVGGGYAKVRDVRNNSGEDHLALKELEGSAKSAGRGMWTTKSGAADKAVRDETSQRDVDHLALFEAVGGKAIDVIVERVRDGTSLRCITTGGDVGFKNFTLLLCGARSPSFKKDKESGEEIADPWAEQAKYFVEAKLLNRKLQVILEIPDERGNFFGTVLHPKGNIAVSLLKQGLAKYVDWSAAHVEYASELRSAEAEAKEKRLRVWTNWTPPPRTVDASAAEFDATVVEVVSGDALVISRSGGDDERVFLASVRAPRFKRSGKSEPLGYEARERVRKLTIGKKVHVILEYVRQPGPNAPENATPRVFATIEVGGRNLAERLIEEGLATAIRHRDDDERSHQYDTLMAAEVGAAKASRGLHKKSKKANAPHIRGDASNDPAKAKMLLELLSNRGTVNGVVEYCINGARFKIFLPSEDVVIAFGLAHVRAPRHDSRNPAASEPFGEESLLFSRRTLMHRDVKLEIETTDKRGTFIGNLFIKKTNHAVSLLKDGLAYMSGYYADRSPYFEEMESVQAGAKASKRGYWATYVEPTPKVVEPTDEGEASSSKGPKVYDVVISEVISATTYYVQVLGKPLEKLNEFMGLFSAFHESYSGPSGSDMGKLKTGNFVAAKFSVDGAWYRAKITTINDEDNTLTVLFVDYGNSETVALDDIRPIADEHMELAPQARAAGLAGCLSASLLDVAEEADDAVRSAFLGRKLRATVEYGSSSEWNVSLYQTDDANPDADPVDVAAQLLSLGYARLNHKAIAGRGKPSPASKAIKKIVQRLEQFEIDAQEARNGMWQYGVVDFDEEE